jgi:hypothetical protein
MSLSHVAIDGGKAQLRVIFCRAGRWRRGSYSPDNEHEGRLPSRLLRAMSGLMHRSKQHPYSITAMNSRRFIRSPRRRG